MAELYAEKASIVYQLKEKMSEILGKDKKSHGNFRFLGYAAGSDMLVFEIIEPHFEEIKEKEQKINDIAKKYDFTVKDETGTKMSPLAKPVGWINPEYEKQKMLISKFDGIVAILGTKYVRITTDISLGQNLMKDLEILYS